MKLEKGDILEFDGNGPYAAKKGARAIYKDTQVKNGVEYINVEWIRDGLSGNQEDGGYHESQFKKVEEVPTQKEDRIFEEIKKEKVMKIEMKESVQRVIDMLEQFNIDFKVDMGNDIKTILNRGEENAIDQIEEIIECIRTNEQYIEEAIERLKNASTLREVLEAMENTVYEEDEATVLQAFLGVDSVTID